MPWWPSPHLAGPQLARGPDWPRSLHWVDLWAQWRSFAAFLLSFVNIAAFWRGHYTFFSYVRRADDKLLALSLFWLLFTVVLPFSTTLLSACLHDWPAILFYCQHLTYRRVAGRYLEGCDHAPGVTQAAVGARIAPASLALLQLGDAQCRRGHYCHVFSPVLAFLLLFTEIPTNIIASLFYRYRRVKS